MCAFQRVSTIYAGYASMHMVRNSHSFVNVSYKNANSYAYEYVEKHILRL